MSTFNSLYKEAVILIGLCAGHFSLSSSSVPKEERDWGTDFGPVANGCTKELYKSCFCVARWRNRSGRLRDQRAKPTGIWAQHRKRNLGYREVETAINA